MKLRGFLSILAILSFAMPCFSKQLREDNEFAEWQLRDHEALAEPHVDWKTYIDPSTIYITSDGIYLHRNGELISISYLGVDDEGVFVQYFPWHDDDWQCPLGHWSPTYADKCVVCNKPRTKKSPQWGDR